MFSVALVEAFVGQSVVPESVGFEPAGDKPLVVLVTFHVDSEHTWMASVEVEPFGVRRRR